jgi:hypothetical protein
MNVVNGVIKRIKSVLPLSNGTKINELVIPSACIIKGKEVPIRKIGKRVFKVCSNAYSDNTANEKALANFRHQIKRLVISDGIEEIEEEAFKETYIDDVIWPASCKTIPADCFAMSKLQSIKNIDKVTEIQENAFSICEKMTDIDWPAGCTIIPDDCFFLCKELIEINGLDNVEEVGFEAFSYCSSLESFDWPAKAKTIPQGCFNQCENLKEINGIEDVQEIEFSAFAHCGFKEFTWPSNAKVIPSNCFASCTKLENLVINGIISSIGPCSILETRITKLDLSNSLSCEISKDLLKTGIKIIYPFYQ